MLNSLDNNELYKRIKYICELRGRLCANHELIHYMFKIANFKMENINNESIMCIHMVADDIAIKCRDDIEKLKNKLENVESYVEEILNNDK